MKEKIYSSLKFLLLMTILTGVIYPLFMTLIAQIFFSDKANGSLYRINGEVRGSFLLSQNFTDSIYFHSRPSAINYNPMPSGASNLGLTSKLLHQQFEERKINFAASNSLIMEEQIPSEMLFASASGVDPHISLKAAYLQIPRIVRARNLDSKFLNNIYKLVDDNIEKADFGILGVERVNVLKLNILLDNLDKQWKNQK
ncbi:MAG: potassium-transporting ATPase subunit KdpC [Ignavibacteriaceae bacterium]|nr:potassium-transporting ATPase subunit KdpC [Ignavibacteriaceae bacterium]